MKILLFGGTTEGRVLAGRLAEMGHDVTVSTATELGAEELQGLDCAVVTGRMDEWQILELLWEYDLVVDATHPYAEAVSRNLRAACREAGVRLERVLRESSGTDGCVRVESCAQAARWLMDRPGRVLAATGSKELHAYACLDPKRLFPRVLPTHEALDACERMGIPHRNILALYGPFSEELNEAILKQYGIRWLVTKDGGPEGGFAEKREAARRAGAELVVVGRPSEEGGISAEELLERLKKEET